MRQSVKYWNYQRGKPDGKIKNAAKRRYKRMCDSIKNRNDNICIVYYSFNTIHNTLLHFFVILNSDNFTLKI